MTNRAKQNWPDGEAIELTDETEEGLILGSLMCAIFGPLPGPDPKADALFGCDCEKSNCPKCNPPNDELNIIFSSAPFEEKLAQLDKLREHKRGFSPSDTFRAHGLGIRLD